MERKREWAENAGNLKRHATVSSRPTTRTGHGPLLWGSIAVIAGYGLTLLGVITGTAGTLFGVALFIGGGITWATGFVLRIRYNKGAPEPLMFTGGEKIALIGAMLFAAGTVLVLATEGDVPALQVISAGGLVIALAGVVWHMLTPRK